MTFKCVSLSPVARGLGCTPTSRTSRATAIERSLGNCALQLTIVTAAVLNLRQNVLPVTLPLVDEPVIGPCNYQWQPPKLCPAPTPRALITDNSARALKYQTSSLCWRPDRLLAHGYPSALCCACVRVWDCLPERTRAHLDRSF